MQPHLNDFIQGFYGPLHFCCICTYTYIRTCPLSFSLKNVMLTLSEKETVSCCLSCAAPQESTLKWDKGFIVSLRWYFKQPGAAEVQESVCEGSCQVQAQLCGQAVAGCCTSRPVAASSIRARELSAALTCIERWKCLQPEKYSGMVECVSSCLLYFFAVYSLFVSIVLSFVL